MISPKESADTIKSIAAAMGFDDCGIAKAMRLDEDARRLENWLNKGLHGEMKYMENHFELRTDPTSWFLVRNPSSRWSSIIFRSNTRMTVSPKLQNTPTAKIITWSSARNCMHFYSGSGKSLVRWKGVDLLTLHRCWKEVGQCKVVWDGSVKTGT